MQLTQVAYCLYFADKAFLWELPKLTNTCKEMFIFKNSLKLESMAETIRGSKRKLVTLLKGVLKH